jgi:hypothetical protein
MPAPCGRYRQGVNFDPDSQSALFSMKLEKAEGHQTPRAMGTDHAIDIEYVAFPCLLCIA